MTGGQVVAGSNPVGPTQVRGVFAALHPYPGGVSAPIIAPTRVLAPIALGPSPVVEHDDRLRPSATPY